MRIKARIKGKDYVGIDKVYIPIPSNKDRGRISAEKETEKPCARKECKRTVVLGKKYCINCWLFIKKQKT